MISSKWLAAAGILALSSGALFGETSGFLGIRAKKGENLAQCAVVGELAPGGPSERAGLIPGDVIASINGEPIDCSALQKGIPVVSGVRLGERVVFGILRDGKAMEIPVVAAAFPVVSGVADQERSRLEAGRAVLERLIRTQEVFTITLPEGGGFEVSGKMTAEEAQDLHYYFQQKRDGEMFPKVMKKKSQDMYLRFDRDRGVVQYEFVDPPAPAEPKS